MDPPLTARVDSGAPGHGAGSVSKNELIHTLDQQGSAMHLARRAVRPGARGPHACGRTPNGVYR